MHDIHGGVDAASPERLSRVDLNLLVAFDALARERSVTRAASRVGVTQSAMSHALRRLRDQFHDPLLVRGKAGMVLTPRALALVVPIRSGLVTFGRALDEPHAFDARSSKRTFCIASPDLFDVVLLPPLLERIRAAAPAIDVAVVPADDRGLADRLETGEIDVAIRPQFEGSLADEIAPGVSRRHLVRDRFVCLLRSGHPALGGSRRSPTIALDAFAASSHVVVSPTGTGRGVVDDALAKHGLSRRVALRIPQFYSALATVAKSDLVLTAPTALARLASSLPVVAVPPPLKLVGHAIHLLWHERFTRDEGHRWLRDLLTEIAREESE